ncbi:MAG: hypothetical protein A2V85_10715 [Chloroflexi bacterium RBG_16_72_14]|nr:MAG: hypothetical protein A2V85_10715 [Chloroflexi bacterium RBG_16_72_14]
MGLRLAAFLLAVMGAGMEFFGAIVGQGLLGTGALFGLAGPGTTNLAVVIGILAAMVSLVLAVLLMFVRNTRSIALALFGAAAVGTLAAGPVFGGAALLTVLGGLLALRVDPGAPAI